MKTPTPAPERFAAVVHVRPRLAAAIKGQHYVTIPIPALVPPVRVGERLFLVEWIGAPTGRADLVEVASIGEGVETTGHLLVRRSFCWAQGKHDTDLSCVSLSVDEKRAIPLIGDL